MPPNCCMPFVRNELPATLLRIVRTANKRVLAVRFLVVFGETGCVTVAAHGLVPGIRGNGRLLPLVRDELLPAAPQRHVFARFLGEPFPVV